MKSMVVHNTENLIQKLKWDHVTSLNVAKQNLYQKVAFFVATFLWLHLQMRSSLSFQIRREMVGKPHSKACLFIAHDFSILDPQLS